MKKKVMNIRPQEVTENGERSVRYKGSDGKFHDVAPDGGGTAQEPLIIRFEHNLASNIVDVSAQEVLEALLAGRRVVYIGHNPGNGNYIIDSGKFHIFQDNQARITIKSFAPHGDFGEQMFHCENSIEFDG